MARATRERRSPCWWKPESGLNRPACSTLHFPLSTLSRSATHPPVPDIFGHSRTFSTQNRGRWARKRTAALWTGDSRPGQRRNAASGSDISRRRTDEFCHFRYDFCTFLHEFDFFLHVFCRMFGEKPRFCTENEVLGTKNGRWKKRFSA